MQEHLIEKNKQLEAKALTTSNDDLLKMFGSLTLNMDLEKDIISSLIKDGRIYCYETDENNEFCHLLNSFSSLLKCNESY